jgi:DNA repair protein RadA/Sms
MATKTKTVWSCTECGHNQSKWVGQCPSCTKWNTLHEEVELSPKGYKFESEMKVASKPRRLSEITLNETPRLSSDVGEIDRLFGGGIVPGSLTLIGGDPGIGKSTLMLQLSNRLAKKGIKVLYVTGEESLEQTSLRAKRIGVQNDNLYLLAETNYSLIKREIDELKPNVIIADSVQILYKPDVASAPGSVSQVREIATEFMHLAKGMNISVFLIGHVTKSGEIAGPRVLEHLVDTVLYFEGDKQQHYRMVRVVKNRFGATDEIAVFQMTPTGLAEVPNPSHIFLEERRKNSIGSVIIPTIEGTRPILIEIQALVTETTFPSPSRKGMGLDANRLSLLLAVLEKRMGYPFFKSDVFVSIAGGIKVVEPAIDLGIVLSLTSSFKNRLLNPETCVMGEVGLGGEVRSVSRAESRLKEAVHMGFTTCILPKKNLKGIAPALKEKIKLIGVETVEEALEWAFA